MALQAEKHFQANLERGSLRVSRLEKLPPAPPRARRLSLGNLEKRQPCLTLKLMLGWVCLASGPRCLRCEPCLAWRDRRHRTMARIGRWTGSDENVIRARTRRVGAQVSSRIVSINAQPAALSAQTRHVGDHAQVELRLEACET